MKKTFFFFFPFIIKFLQQCPNYIKLQISYMFDPTKIAYLTQPNNSYLWVEEAYRAGSLTLLITYKTLAEPNYEISVCNLQTEERRD